MKKEDFVAGFFYDKNTPFGKTKVTVIEKIEANFSPMVKKAYDLGLSVFLVDTLDDFIGLVHGFIDVILVTKTWATLSEISREAIIAHEIGHRENNHYTKRKTKRNYGIHEFEAELYGAIVLGVDKMIHANIESQFELISKGDKSRSFFNQKIDQLRSLKITGEFEEYEEKNGVNLLPGTKIFKISGKYIPFVKVLGTHLIVVTEEFLNEHNPKVREMYYAFHQQKNFHLNQNIEVDKDERNATLAAINDLKEKYPEIIKIIRKIDGCLIHNIKKSRFVTLLPNKNARIAMRTLIETQELNHHLSKEEIFLKATELLNGRDDLMFALHFTKENFAEQITPKPALKIINTYLTAARSVSFKDTLKIFS
jgi:hypothetical protein